MMSESSMTENESESQSKVKSIKSRKHSKFSGSVDKIKKSTVKQKSLKVKKTEIPKQKTSNVEEISHNGSIESHDSTNVIRKKKKKKKKKEVSRRMIDESESDSNIKDQTDSTGNESESNKFPFGAVVIVSKMFYSIIIFLSVFFLV